MSVASWCLDCDRSHRLYSPPGSSVHGILQARILEWVAIPFSRGSSQPREPGIEPASPALQADYLPSQPPGKPINARSRTQIPGSLAPEAVLKHPIAKNAPAMQETPVRFLGQEDPLEKGLATHSSILAWRIPRTEEPGGLQSMGSQRGRYN